MATDFPLEISTNAHSIPDSMVPTKQLIFFTAIVFYQRVEEPR